MPSLDDYAGDMCVRFSAHQAAMQTAREEGARLMWEAMLLLTNDADEITGVTKKLAALSIPEVMKGKP